MISGEIGSKNKQDRECQDCSDFDLPHGYPVPFQGKVTFKNDIRKWFREAKPGPSLWLEMPCFDEFLS